MRAVLQRVLNAHVTVDGHVVGKIGAGLCVLLGAEMGDTESDVVWTASKVAGARLFHDAEGKMNRDVLTIGGAVLAVPQFTLIGDLRSGRRPSFGRALEPQAAQLLFDLFCAELRRLGVLTETGKFREHMEVTLTNDGPVTILLDSRKTF